jgi:hypothetical protein
MALRITTLAATLLLSATVVSANAIPLTCLGPGGREVSLGVQACLPTGQGPRLAVCSRVLNLSSWAVTEVGCMPSPQAG